MTGKEKVQNWLSDMPDHSSVAEILACLHERFHQERSPAVPGVDFQWPAPDVTQEEWMQFVAQGLRDELADPREDVYSEATGEPVDGQR